MFSILGINGGRGAIGVVIGSENEGYSRMVIGRDDDNNDEEKEDGFTTSC